MVGLAPAQLGWLFAWGAYSVWGLVPLYFKAVAHVSPLEVVAHRIVWSFALLAVLVTLMARWRRLVVTLRGPGTAQALALSALLVSMNWFTFIYAVSSNQVSQASLGYFINPLVTVALGMLFLGERLRRLQLISLGLAVAGVVVLTVAQGGPPIIALTLALSFGFYGLIRKRLAVGAVDGLLIETAYMVPVAAALFGVFAASGTLSFGRLDPTTDVLLVLAAVITSVPLLLFAGAAQRIPLSALGFLQYLAPTLHLLLAVFVFSEVVEGARLVGFVIIWVGLGLFIVDALRATGRTAGAVTAATGTSATPRR